MRSQVWKISRRLAALKYAYRPHSAETRIIRKPRACNGKLDPAVTVGDQRGEGRSHILFLAGDLAALKKLLRREMNLPVRVRKLRCASVAVERSRDLHALAVMRALKRSLHTKSKPLSHRFSNGSAGYRKAFSAWKH
jgi:hypothetical protein